MCCSYDPVPHTSGEALILWSTKHNCLQSAVRYSRKHVVWHCMQVVISEWGVGGGARTFSTDSVGGKLTSASVSEVAKFPFFGLWYPYSADKNPWLNKSYNEYR